MPALLAATRLVTPGALLALTTPDAQAYVGPAAGLSLIGALAGLLSVLGILLWGLLRWALRPAFRLRHSEGPAAPAPQSAGTDMEPAPDDLPAEGTAPKSPPGVGLRVAYVAIGLAIALFFGDPREFLYSAVIAVHQTLKRFGDPVAAFHTEAARFPAGESGVVTHDRAAAYAGLNLEVSATAARARLLDMSGRELHRWELGLDAISRAWAAEGMPLADLSGTHWRRARALPGGDLLVVLERSEANPYGLGLIRIDWESRVRWMAPKHYHHSVDVGPDGSIYTLYQELTRRPVTGIEHIDPPFLDEGIAILTSDGREIDRIGIVEAFRGTAFESFLRLARQDALGDPLHMNHVAVVTPEQAAHSDIARAGQILVSMRNISTVAVIDPGSRKVVWADSALWAFQHDPVLGEGSRILIFDNRGPAQGNSRVVEWDTAARRVTWQWAGTPDMPLQSAKWGSVVRLPNGNRLISESEGGRAIEVAPDGRTVWEWRTDQRFGTERERIGRLMSITRLPASFFVDHGLPTGKM